MDLRTAIESHIHNTRCSKVRNTFARTRGTLTFNPPPTPREIIKELGSIENSQYLTRFNHLNNAVMRMQGRTDTCQQISFAKYYFLHHQSDVDLHRLGLIYENIMQDAYDYNYKEVIDKLDQLDKVVLLESFSLDFFEPVNNEANKISIQDFNIKVENYILGSLYNNYRLEHIISELLKVNPYLFPSVDKTYIDITIKALTKNINWETSVDDLYQQYLRAFMTDTIYYQLKKELLNPEGRIVTIPYPLDQPKNPTVVTAVNNNGKAIKGKLIYTPKYRVNGGKKRKTNKRKKKKSQTKKNKRRGKKKSKSRKNRR